MFKKILVALDGSKPSETILEHLLKFTKSIDIDLRLVHVAAEKARDVRSTQDYLDGIAKKLSNKFPSVDSVILRGRVAGKLISHAALEGYDLIALTTHARTGVGRFLYGSVAEELLQNSPVPLFLVRPDSVPAKIRSIIVPLDGSERSSSILPLAGDFAQATGAKATLLTVRPGTKLAQTVSSHLVEALDTLQEREVSARLVVRHGEPVEEILAALSRPGGDLIALSTHGRTGEARRKFGSIAEEILRQSPCPLLVQRTVGQRKRRPLVIALNGRISQLNYVEDEP